MFSCPSIRILMLGETLQPRPRLGKVLSGSTPGAIPPQICNGERMGCGTCVMYPLVNIHKTMENIGK